MPDERIGFTIEQPIYHSDDPHRKTKSIKFRRGLLRVEELPGFIRWEVKTSGLDTAFWAYVADDIDIENFGRHALIAMGDYYNA